MNKRKSINLKIALTKEQAKLFRIYKRYHGYGTDQTAARRVFLEGLWDFYGTNTANPDLPELYSVHL